MVQNNKYAENKSIVKITGIPRSLMMERNPGHPSLSDVLLALHETPSDDMRDSTQSNIVVSIEATKETDSSGSWFIVVNRAQFHTAVEQITQTAAVVSESPAYKAILHSNIFPYMHRGILVNGKSIPTYSDQVRLRGKSLQEQMEANQNDDADMFQARSKRIRKNKPLRLRPEDMLSYDDVPQAPARDTIHYPRLPTATPPTQVARIAPIHQGGSTPTTRVAQISPVNPYGHNFPNSSGGRNTPGGRFGFVGGRTGGITGIGRGAAINAPAWQTQMRPPGSTQPHPFSPIQPLDNLITNGSQGQSPPQQQDIPHQYATTIDHDQPDISQAINVPIQAMPTSVSTTTIPTTIQTKALTPSATDQVVTAFMQQQMQIHTTS
jgi:hypothetical protein